MNENSMTLGADLLAKLGKCEVGESKRITATVKKMSDGMFKVTDVGYSREGESHEKSEEKSKAKGKRKRPAAVDEALNSY